MCPSKRPGGAPLTAKKVTDNISRALDRNRHGRLANVADHLVRLARTPSWAWHPERHEPGCRYAAMLRRAGL